MSEHEHKQEGEGGSSGYRLPRLWRFFLAWIAFFFLLGYDPIGEGPYKDRLLVGLTNYLSAPAYRSEARDHIVLVMADTVSLAELDLSWPLPFATQAVIIGKILQHEPRVLAMDLLFLDRRGDSGLEFLEDTIEEHKRSIPIIGAAAPVVGRQEQRTQILPLSVEADITVRTEWRDMGYRLLSESPQSDASPLSFALAIYKAACERKREDESSVIDDLCARHADFDEADFQREMLVFWGSGRPDYNAIFDGRMDIANKIFRCVSDTNSILERIVRMVLRQERSPRETCAFHPVIPLDLLMKLDDDVLRPALADKIVIYGLDHPGIPDIVNPPTSHQLPGAHLHAMALDNLLTFGADYFGTATPELWAIGSLSLPILKYIDALLIFLVIFALLLAQREEESERVRAKAAELSHTKLINDFDDLRLAIGQFLQRFSRRRIQADLVAALDPWNRQRDQRAAQAGSGLGAAGVWVRWAIGILPVVVRDSVTGRCLLIAGAFAFVVWLDLYVFLVPPINALTLLAILGASQLVVPARIFRPRPRSEHKSEAQSAKVAAD